MKDEPTKILVIANETVDGDALHSMLRARQPIEVLVVAPALNSRLRHWTSDEDEARRRAGLRLGRCLAWLGSAGITASGWVGDADPLQAIGDGLHAFAADEIVIATRPPGRSHWLARHLVERARFRYAQPVHHVVIDERPPEGGLPCERVVEGSGGRWSRLLIGRKPGAHARHRTSAA